MGLEVREGGRGCLCGWGSGKRGWGLGGGLGVREGGLGGVCRFIAAEEWD